MIASGTDLPFGEAVETTRGLLQEAGYGILSEIDVKAKLEEKLGVEREPYVILGACNSPLARQGLDAEPDLGALLPCNVIVYEREGRARGRGGAGDDALHGRQRGVGADRGAGPRRSYPRSSRRGRPELTVRCAKRPSGRTSTLTRADFLRVAGLGTLTLGGYGVLPTGHRRDLPSTPRAVETGRAGEFTLEAAPSTSSWAGAPSGPGATTGAYRGRRYGSPRGRPCASAQKPPAGRHHGALARHRAAERHGRRPARQPTPIKSGEDSTFDFVADNPGGWFFHCHLSYRMETGMARVVSYEA